MVLPPEMQSAPSDVPVFMQWGELPSSSRDVPDFVCDNLWEGGSQPLNSVNNASSGSTYGEYS